MPLASCPFGGHVGASPVHGADAWPIGGEHCPGHLLVRTSASRASVTRACRAFRAQPMKCVMTKITFLSANGREIVVNANDGDSVMQAASLNDVPGIVAECGGSMMCATCHCYVDPGWWPIIAPPSEEETDMLTCAAGEVRIAAFPARSRWDQRWMASSFTCPRCNCERRPAIGDRRRGAARAGRGPYRVIKPTNGKRHFRKPVSIKRTACRSGWTASGTNPTQFSSVRIDSRRGIT